MDHMQRLLLYRTFGHKSLPLVHIFSISSGVRSAVSEDQKGVLMISKCHVVSHPEPLLSPQEPQVSQ